MYNRLYLLPVPPKKLSNNIQQEAMTAANPSTKPMNNQALAPLGPKQPPEKESPLTWALETAFIL